MMTLDDAILNACRAVQINPPKRKPVPGRWTKADTYEANGKDDGRVLVFDDLRGCIAWNHQTGQKQTFRIGQAGEDPAPRKRDMAKERADRERAELVERVCDRILRACDIGKHPYLARKGFPDEEGLICENVPRLLPECDAGRAMARALPSTEGPLLIVPGRIGSRITTVQFITTEGEKKNLLHGRMGGASHRIATGPMCVVCEGIATALTVRAALRLLGVSATVLSAFAASNVARVAAAMPGALIASDHDKPIEHLQGKGTGEFYAIASGCRWTMPPERGDFNDWHMRDGLRAVALHLRGVLG